MLSLRGDGGVGDRGGDGEGNGGVGGRGRVTSGGED